MTASEVILNLVSLCWDPKMELTDFSSTDEVSASSTEPLEMAMEELTKICTQCHESLPFEAFYACSKMKDGRQTACKKCFQSLYTSEKKRSRTDVEVHEQAEIPQLEFPDSLYIMENPRIPGEVKIERSQNPEERAKQLSAGNNFRLIVRHSYGEKGFLEKTLHQKLKSRRVEEVAGVEWFKVSADQADILIKAAIVEDELAKSSIEKSSA